MRNITIIYWSGTGNTAAMANAILNGANNENTQVKLLTVDKATLEDVINCDKLALGCPAMGAEQLEEMEMQPFIDSIQEVVAGKDIVLFGSYGWGNGEWMDTWQETMREYGANLLTDGLMVNNDPDEESLKECEKIGNLLAKS